MKRLEIEQRIYVACLDAYNNGYLHGTWIELNQSLEAIKVEIYDMLSQSPMPGAEEWEIHDDEGFGSFRLPQYCGLEEAKAIADFLSESGAVGAELLSYYGGSLEDARRALEDYYHGEHDSVLDFATYIFDECYWSEVPETIQPYIDYEAFARDIFIDSYFSLEADGKTHVFSCH